MCSGRTGSHKMEVRGLKDIATHNSTVNRGMPGTRQRAAFELALLEHEKTRLQREIGMWTANQKQAETRLRSARERSALLTKLLQEAAVGERSRRRPRTRRQPRVCSSVALEY
jgi:hypothetical protein